MRLSLILLFVLSFSTIQSQNTVDSKEDLVVTRYRLNAEDLKLEDKVSSEKIFLKVFHNNSNSILDEYILHSPKKNEISFFYGLDPETNTQEMYFKFDADLENFYKDKEIDQIVEVIKILNYNVFSKTDFSVALAYKALKKSVTSITIAVEDNEDNVVTTY